VPTTPTTAPLYAIKAELFRSLAHPIRIQVLEVLSSDPDHAAPVSRLLAATGAEASALSQHLAVLKRAGVVTSARTGNTVVYSLSRPLVAELLVVARDQGGRLVAGRVERPAAQAAGAGQVDQKAEL
jgi:ArsR family transcriptional regulator